MSARPITLREARVLARFRRGTPVFRPQARRWLMADGARIEPALMRALKAKRLVTYDRGVELHPGRSRAQAFLTETGRRALAVLPAFCRVCGCTDARACPGGCSWALPDLCSACVP